VGITDPDVFSTLFHSRSIPPHGDNRGRYRNSEVDRLLEEGRRVADFNRRIRIYGTIQKILAEELPYIPLWWAKNVVVMSPAVRGFTLYPDGDLISLKNVSLQDSRPRQ
jgi:peptide/nickel transport system substrate-binding protein